MKCLLLNASMEILRILSWQKAITLWYCHKVNILENYDILLHSPNIDMPMPSVIQLKKYVNPYSKRNKISYSRYNILVRDRFTCQYCGTKFSEKLLTLDHVIPKRLKGETSWENIVACCKLCNSHKSGRTPLHAKMKLLKEPIKPKFLYNQLYEEEAIQAKEIWRKYIYK